MALPFLLIITFCPYFVSQIIFIFIQCIVILFPYIIHIFLDRSEQMQYQRGFTECSTPGGFESVS
jgi:hypothetical protein